MPTTAKKGRKVHMPTTAEDAAINAGIAADPDNPEWTEEDFAKAKPAAEFFGPEVFAKLVAMQRPRGGRKGDKG